MNNVFYSLGLTLVILFVTHAAVGQDNYEERITGYLLEQSQELGLQPADVQEISITDNYVSRHNGVRHVYITQSRNGLPIVNATASVAIAPNGDIVHVANRMISGIATSGPEAIHSNFSPKEVISRACKELDIAYTENFSSAIVGSADKSTFSNPDISLEPIPVERVYWADPEGNLQLAWRLSIYELDQEHWWEVIINDKNGELVRKTDWVTHCENALHAPVMANHNHAHQSTASSALPSQGAPDAYRVFALPYESPLNGNRTLEVDPADSLASPYGWHDIDGSEGAEYTITRGNNAFAYEDGDGDNDPGYSPDGGSNLEFDFPMNLGNHPSSFQDAAITNVFYVNNRIHDITYHYGFDENSGNFQVNNYGRGGVGGDEVQVEAQDGGGSNNANFATPPEGSQPRMQMYLWGSGDDAVVTVNSPGSIAGTYTAVAAGFGGAIPTTPLTADFALVDDNTGTDPNDACEPIVNGNELDGNIAVIMRGGCTFVDKIEAAQNEGAVAVIMVNDEPGPPITMGGSGPNITIPSVMISRADGLPIIDELENSNTVNGSLDNGGSSSVLDGDLDNGIVVHEYGHGISNRLTGGPSNASCLSNAEQMGEGWSDFLTCILTLDFSQPNPVTRAIGNYVQGNSMNGPGIRNEPYDTSFAVNDYTYGDVNNTSLLTQPHGVGFVWATMLWDLTWALMDAHGYDDNLENGTGGDNIALQLVMDGMKLQACNPGFEDGRDAILLADELNYNGANKCLIWEVFARRGLGYSADQGSPSSRTDQQEAFDIPVGCQTPVQPPTADFVADTTETCSGEIYFTDQSTHVPQNWIWHFGDGTTDSVRNPKHTYTEPGTYTVKLVVTNSLGADSLERTQYIHYDPPEAPVVTGASGCTGDVLTLEASASGNINWMDSAYTVLHTGTKFATDSLSNTTTFYTVNELSAPAQKVGPINENFGSGGYHGTLFIGTVDFTAEAPFTLISAYVNAGSPGEREVFLWDEHSAGGNIIQSATFDVGAGPGRVELNFEITEPGEYSIGLNNADLYRNDAGASYPYTLPGVVSIVGSSAGSDYYYYFYDLEVQQESCTGDTVAVTAQIIDSVDFDFEVDQLTVDFKDESNATAGWFWEFGDGNTSTDPNPTHTYATSGDYTVTLSVGSCTRSYDITVGSVGLESTEPGAAWALQVHPNPAREQVIITAQDAPLTNVPMRLMAVDGRVMKTFDFPAGARQYELSVANLAPAVYWLVPSGVGRSEALKIVVLK